MKFKTLLTCAVAAGVLATTSGVQASVVDKETLYQTALLQSLTASYYDGFITVRELKKHGDTGIGTFQGVNGEMIFIDGEMYQALGDGRVVEARDNETVPFADVTFFKEDGKEEIENVGDINVLKSILNAIVAKNGVNNFYIVKVEGDFNSVLVRSELKQEKPYKPLAAALATDQREFTYKDLDGSIVALYCPSYMKGVNTPGWHFHFISENRKKGGHLLAVDIKKAKVKYDITRSFTMILPKDNAFHQLDLSVDQSADIHKVEQQDKASMNESK